MGTASFWESTADPILQMMDGPLPERTTGKCLDMLLEPMERRCGSTGFGTRCLQTDRFQRIGSGVHADRDMEQIIHNSARIDSGSHNMGEKNGAVRHGRTRWTPVAPTQAATGLQRQ